MVGASTFKNQREIRLQRLVTVVKFKFLCIALLLVLAGCASKSIPNAPKVDSSIQLNEFKSGAVRLHCESACTLRWRVKSQNLKALHDNKLWMDLATEVRDIGYLSDLSYYYLGRAAEGLGHTEAATTYYRLALAYLHRCEGWISGCDGFDFPRDIKVRLVGLPMGKPPNQPASSTESSKTIGVPSTPSTQPIHRVKSRAGTGFFIHSEGVLVTSLHVVDKANNISVNTRGDVKFAAQLLAKNEPCDLAVLKVASRVQDWLPIQKDLRKIKRGSEVLTVGFPRVDLQGLEAKVTNGLISSLTGVLNDPNFFQISVPIQPGNSGGPLVSRDGVVVGVISSKLAINPSLDTSHVQPENVNYAVKSSCLRDLLRTLPTKYRYESRKNNKVKEVTKGRKRNQLKDLTIVELTERVEKTVALVVVTAH